MAGTRMIMLILTFGAVAAAVTVVIAKYSGGRRLPKYIPALLTLMFAAYCLIRALTPSAGWDALVFAALTMLVSGVGVVALIAAVALDLAALRGARRDVHD